MERERERGEGYLSRPKACGDTGLKTNSWVFQMSAQMGFSEKTPCLVLK